MSWIDKLPVVRLTAREFMDLDDYSASFPTGTTTGKRWRRQNGIFDRSYRGRCQWVICTYGETSANGKTIKIHYHRPIISVPMA